MCYIARFSSEDKNVELSEIALEHNIPKHFLSKILQMLVKQKLLVSMKGPTGGFRLNRRPEEITLIQVVDAIDGLDIFSQCGIGFKKCDENDPCPIHTEYKRIRDRVRDLFEQKTLASLNYDIQNGDSIARIVQPAETGKQA
jgi:Rrf2 family transcriptional regulator, iron-sulfur cluster assembly transcription factor